MLQQINNKDKIFDDAITTTRTKIHRLINKIEYFFKIVILQIEKCSYIDHLVLYYDF